MSFGCGANSEGCWCTQVEILPPVAAELRERYDDCICPVCLTSLSAGPAIVVTYPDGSVEIIREAVRVDTLNFHEGMFDFYDRGGTLLRQIDMGSDISWKIVSPG